MRAGVDYVGVSTPFYCNDGNGLFLLHRRSQNCRDECGAWDPGGGQLEHGLTPEENVLREVMEEYGCIGEIQEKLPAHSVIREWQGKKTHWLAIPFFVKVDPKEARNNEPHSIDEIGWFRLNKLPEPLHTGFVFKSASFPEFFDKYR